MCRFNPCPADVNIEKAIPILEKEYRENPNQELREAIFSALQELRWEE